MGEIDDIFRTPNTAHDVFTFGDIALDQRHPLTLKHGRHSAQAARHHADGKALGYKLFDRSLADEPGAAQHRDVKCGDRVGPPDKRLGRRHGFAGNTRKASNVGAQIDEMRSENTIRQWSAALIDRLMKIRDTRQHALVERVSASNKFQLAGRVF